MYNFVYPLEQDSGYVLLGTRLSESPQGERGHPNELKLEFSSNSLGCPPSVPSSIDLRFE